MTDLTKLVRCARLNRQRVRAPSPRCTVPNASQMDGLASLSHSSWIFIYNSNRTWPWNNQHTVGKTCHQSDLTSKKKELQCCRKQFSILVATIGEDTPRQRDVLFAVEQISDTDQNCARWSISDCRSRKFNDANVSWRTSPSTSDMCHTPITLDESTCVSTMSIITGADEGCSSMR